MKHQWIPAKKDDIIKKVPSGYLSKVKDGDHFVVLDVYDGDSTAVVLGRDGKLYTIVYPEEYEVVGTVAEFIGKKDNRSKTDSHTWFDVDAQYYYLNDPERTPMNVKWIDDGVVKLESESGSHVCTSLLNGINNVITIIDPNEI